MKRVFNGQTVKTDSGLIISKKKRYMTVMDSHAVGTVRRSTHLIYEDRLRLYVGFYAGLLRGWRLLHIRYC
jgi:hypothetical protein